MNLVLDTKVTVLRVVYVLPWRCLDVIAKVVTGEKTWVSHVELLHKREILFFQGVKVISQLLLVKCLKLGEECMNQAWSRLYWFGHGLAHDCNPQVMSRSNVYKYKPWQLSSVDHFGHVTIFVHFILCHSFLFSRSSFDRHEGLLAVLIFATYFCGLAAKTYESTVRNWIFSLKNYRKKTYTL